MNKNLIAISIGDIDGIGIEILINSWKKKIVNKFVLFTNKRIFQTWRTSQFDEDEEDSQIEVLLDEVNGKTEFTLIHTNLPRSGEHYKQGWEDHYFEPMRKYFSK